MKNIPIIHAWISIPAKLYFRVNFVNRKPAKKVTRLKLLKAARKIFAQYAYHVASIRMIGKEAKIDYPLISYYFPSKAVLFEAVL